MTWVESPDHAGDALAGGSQDALLLAPADNDRGLDGVCRSVLLGEELRRVVDLNDLVGLQALLTERARAHEVVRAQIAGQAALLEQNVREADRAVEDTSDGIAQTHVRIENLQARLADLRQATTALIDAGEATLRADSQKEGFENAVARWEHVRPALDRAIGDIEQRLSIHSTARLLDNDRLAWSESDLRARLDSAAVVAERAKVVRTDALAVAHDLQQTQAAADDAYQQLVATAEDCRCQLQSVPCPPDHAVRTALASYTASCRSGELDPDANALAERWAVLERRSVALARSQPPPPSPDVLDAARGRLDKAEALAQQAELTAQHGPLSSTERAELDRAHRLVSNSERLLRRRWPGHANRRAAAQARLDSLLAGHGFTDFLDYRLRHAQCDGEWVDALDAARQELADARAAVQALEEACAPSPEARALEHERTALRRAAEQLLGFEPGDESIEQLLRSKPTASGELTRFLAAALRDVGVQLRECSLDSAARGWLATADTQRRIRTGAERRLALLDQQIEVIQGFGAADPTVPALEEALRTVALLGADRAQHASRVRDVLNRELGARVHAATLDEDDVDHAAVLDARLAALRLVVEDGDQRVRDEASAAADASDRAIADRECASQSVEVARHDLVVSIGREAEPDSVLSVALAELNDLLSIAEAKHRDLASAIERRHIAYAELAAVTEELVRHAEVAPPRLPDQPGPFEVVNALRWLTEGDESGDEDAVIVYAGRDRIDELDPGTISALSQLSRHRWVIYAPKPPESSSVEHRDSPAADNDDLRAASAPNEVAIRRAPWRGIRSLRWRREPRRQADRV